MTSSRLTRMHRIAAEPSSRPALPLLCRGGARKWNAVAYTLAVAATAAGCSFTDFSKTEPPDAVTEPACLQPSTVMDASTATAGTIARFTFDDGQWHDVNQRFTLVPAADSDGGTAIAKLSEIPRINGVGQSLTLEGHQFAWAADNDLFPGEFTVAAWISVPARIFTSDGPAALNWSIVSALSDDNETCSGYQLDIRSQRLSADSTKVQTELVLSYQSHDRGDAGVAGPCRLRSLHAPIDVPSWATGTGRWHHVAGTLAKLDDGTFQASLFWDVKRIQVQDPFEPLPATDISVPAGDRALYVGASALDPTSAEQTKFTGYIDEIAIFGRPLTEQQLNEFVLATTTHPGPSNCRWRASEQWDTTAFSASYAKLQVCSNEGCSVVIDDQEWGAGALDARLEPPRNIHLYDKAHLYGDFPEGRAFQFTLASGDNFCTWTYLGHGRKEYVIDLTNPVSCVSSSCEVDFHFVDRASITSEWAIPNDSRARSMETDPKKRSDGEEVFVVDRLEFARATPPQPDSTGYGGVYGLLGYCWRLQAYEPETAAEWNRSDAAAWTASMSAQLTGPANSGTRVMADFGERGLNIEGCSNVTVDAELPTVGSNSTKYTLAVQDVNGSWRGYDLTMNLSTGRYTTNTLGNPSSSSENEKYDNYARFPNDAGMNPERVRLLGLQKPWGYAGKVDVTIHDLSFNPPGCERPGPG